MKQFFFSKKKKNTYGPIPVEVTSSVTPSSRHTTGSPLVPALRPNSSGGTSLQLRRSSDAGSGCVCTKRKDKGQEKNKRKRKRCVGQFAFFLWGLIVCGLIMSALFLCNLFIL